MRLLLATALIALACPAFADQTSGKVATFDRAKSVLTMKDRTVWMLPADTVVPPEVVPGSTIRIDYVSNSDNGWLKIVRISKVAG